MNGGSKKLSENLIKWPSRKAKGGKALLNINWKRFSWEAPEKSERVKANTLGVAN